MEIKAEIVLPTKELREDIPFFTNTLKMKMDMIYVLDIYKINTEIKCAINLCKNKGN